jgi:transcriptional regulator with XRE-family HTH domain
VPPDRGSRRGERARRGELGDFLRAQRARLRPADVGLPDGDASARRRIPGLRRDEVAQLSGVGVTWYTWLEQGRDVVPSAQVIDALARALLLDGDQHRYLRELAGLVVPAQTSATEAALPRLQRLVDAAAPNVACVYDAHFDYVVWNQPYVRVRHDPGEYPAHRRNLLWMMFTDATNRARMLNWEPAARAVLSQFRTAVGQRPHNPRHVEIVTELTEASPEFRDWWAEYPVRSFRPATIGIDHPEVGRIALELFQLRPVEHPDLLLVIQVPATDHDVRLVARLVNPP